MRGRRVPQDLADRAVRDYPQTIDKEVIIEG
jgi:hypothetical protein